MDKYKLKTIILYIMSFYSNHYFSNVTYNFFIDKATDVLDGKLSIKEFKSLKIPEPKEDEVGGRISVNL